MKKLSFKYYADRTNLEAYHSESKDIDYPFCVSASVRVVSHLYCWQVHMSSLLWLACFIARKSEYQIFDLPSAFLFGYHSLVTERNVTGIGVSNEGGHTATFFVTAVFLCPHIMASLLWAGHMGSRKARRSFVRYANPYGSALFAVGVARVGKNHLTKE